MSKPVKDVAVGTALILGAEYYSQAIEGMVSEKLSTGNETLNMPLKVIARAPALLLQVAGALRFLGAFEKVSGVNL